MCHPKIFEMLQKISLYRVQIGLQSISLETNKITGRGLQLEKFKTLVLQFKSR
jgi:coproporphyrinogen III oxidase-like Fe-S oxidoreductase